MRYTSHDLIPRHIREYVELAAKDRLENLDIEDINNFIEDQYIDSYNALMG